MNRIRKISAFTLILVVLLSVGFIRMDVLAASKIKVKSTYTNDIGKSFKSLKKKYGWKIRDGFMETAGRCYFSLPNNRGWYIFQGDTSTGVWKMKSNSKCKSIRIKKLSNALTGMKKNMSASSFTKKLYSKGKKATHTRECYDPYSPYTFLKGDDGYCEVIIFYDSKGRRRYMTIDLPGKNSRKIKKNAYVSIS